ncbi:MAG: NADH-quinone oxidoreductase subunit A [Opitutales bacterium]|nr:NADH-quinone oxidoreductase subunit A [Opitutales bacterium]MCH8539166.1 NADH-quinone oxidoreductase subunit A [Opitutales bacterium]
MELVEYFPILVQILLAFVLAVVILTVSQIFGQKIRRSLTKDSAYECGIPSEGKSHTRFSVKFYVTAMLFILFDIEVVFLYPWALAFRDFLAAGIPILLPVLFFIGVIVLGLFYEMKKGALEWEK